MSHFSQLPFGDFAKRASMASTSVTGNIAPLPVRNVITDAPAGPDGKPVEAEGVGKTPMDMGAAPQTHSGAIAPGTTSTELATGQTADQLALQDEHAKLQQDNLAMKNKLELAQHQAAMAKVTGSAASATPATPESAPWPTSHMTSLQRTLKRTSSMLDKLEGGVSMPVKLAMFKIADIPAAVTPVKMLGKTEQKFKPKPLALTPAGGLRTYHGQPMAPATRTTLAPKAAPMPFDSIPESSMAPKLQQQVASGNVGRPGVHTTGLSKLPEDLDMQGRRARIFGLNEPGNDGWLGQLKNFGRVGATHVNAMLPKALIGDRAAGEYQKDYDALTAASTPDLDKAETIAASPTVAGLPANANPNMASPAELAQLQSDQFLQHTADKYENAPAGAVTNNIVDSARGAWTAPEGAGKLRQGLGGVGNFLTNVGITGAQGGAGMVDNSNFLKEDLGAGNYRAAGGDALGLLGHTAMAAAPAMPMGIGRLATGFGLGSVTGGQLLKGLAMRGAGEGIANHVQNLQGDAAGGDQKWIDNLDQNRTFAAANPGTPFREAHPPPGQWQQWLQNLIAMLPGFLGGGPHQFNPQEDPYFNTPRSMPYAG